MAPDRYSVLLKTALDQHEEDMKTAFCRAMSHREEEQPAFELLAHIAQIWRK
jgi:hypothetical protein